MKKPSDLYDLIHSLSKSEKRYISLSIKQARDKKGYLKLFSAINKQKRFDENALYETLRHEKFIQWLPSLKHYLYKLILKKLSTYYWEQAPETRINELFIETDILYKKNLFSQVNENLSIIRRLSEKIDDHVLLLKCSQWERKLRWNSLYKSTQRTDINNALQNEIELAQKIENLCKYYIIESEMNTYFHSREGIRGSVEKHEVQKLLKHPLLADEKKALSVEAKYLHYQLRSSYHYLLEDYTKTLQDIQSIVSIIEPHIYSSEIMMKRWVNVLNNTVIIEMDMQNFTGALYSIKKMRDIVEGTKKLSENMRMFIAVRVYDLALSLSVLSGNIETTKETVPFVEQVIKKYDTMGPLYLINLSYIAAYAHFVLGNYKQALAHLNTILNYKKGNFSIKEGIHSYSKILQLIIHYEMGTELLPKYLLESTYRFLAKKKLLYKTEAAILAFIKNKLLRNFKRRKLHASFIELKDEIVKITESPYEKIVLKKLDILSWLESKIQKRPFAEIVQEKASASGRR